MLLFSFDSRPLPCGVVRALATTLRNFAFLALSALILPGCGKQVSFSRNFSNSSSSSEMVVNNQRTASRTNNRVTRKLETTTDVQIQNGRITSFPKGALVKLEETGSPIPRSAEFRENASTMELWIKEKNTFRPATSEEETWAQTALSDFSK